MTGRDRGQLLLAGAFVLAAALVGLTLVLSATNYTATLADSDNAVTSGSTALTVRDAVDADLGQYLQRVNRKYASNSQRETNFAALVDPYSDRLEGYYADNGQLLEVSTAPSGSRFVDGARVFQDSTGQFDDPSDGNDGDWEITPTGGSEGTLRNVTFIVTSVTASASDKFEFVLEDGAGDSWTLTIHENGGNWIIGSPATTQECTFSSGPVELDFAESTVDGDYCRALEVSDAVDSPYSVAIREGNSVQGRYWMTLNPDSGVTNYFSATSWSSEEERVLYAARVDLVYQSATVTFDSRLRIAPGEIP
jgi:hypothetical protein